MSVRRSEFEECVGCCRRFMMVGCEDIGNEESVEDDAGA